MAQQEKEQGKMKKMQAGKSSAGNDALLQACLNSNISSDKLLEQLDLLLEQGALVHHCNYKTQTPLAVLMSRSHRWPDDQYLLQAIFLLTEHGALLGQRFDDAHTLSVLQRMPWAVLSFGATFAGKAAQASLPQSLHSPEALMLRWNSLKHDASPKAQAQYRNLAYALGLFAPGFREQHFQQTFFRASPNINLPASIASDLQKKPEKTSSVVPLPPAEAFFRKALYLHASVLKETPFPNHFEQFLAVSLYKLFAVIGLYEAIALIATSAVDVRNRYNIPGFQEKTENSPAVWDQVVASSTQTWKNAAPALLFGFVAAITLGAYASYSTWNRNNRERNVLENHAPILKAMTSLLQQAEQSFPENHSKHISGLEKKLDRLERTHQLEDIVARGGLLLWATRAKSQEQAEISMPTPPSI